MAHCGMRPRVSHIVVMLLLAPCAEGLRLQNAVEPTTRRRHLSMIVPTYEGHLGPWTKFMTSVASSLSVGEGEHCVYAEFTVLSIVSSEAEKTLFSAALKQIEGDMNCAGGCQKIMNSFRIETLPRVRLGYEGTKLMRSLLRRNVSAPALTQNRTDDVGHDPNKFVLQSAKKMYGCLFAHSIYSASDATNSDGDLCFAADSEGYLLRNSTVCEIATSYMQHRVVLTSPIGTANPPHQRVVRESRNLLHGPDDAHFGNFYAMEGYHWFWEPRLVWDFTNEIELLGQTAGSYYIEETFNHFIFARRHALGYSFVDVHAEVARIVGPEKFKHMKDTRPQNEPLESICAHLASLEDSEVHQIGGMLSNHGVLMMRCDMVCSSCQTKCALLQQHLDMCVSTSWGDIVINAQ